MTTMTVTDRRAAAAARQRASRARRAKPRPVRACDCCGREWVPQRQGRFCSRQCVERAAHLRRLLTQPDGFMATPPDWSVQRQRLVSWTRSAGSRIRGPWTGVRGVRRAMDGDWAERMRLLQLYRHLLVPEMELELLDAGLLWGPAPYQREHCAAFQPA